MTAEPERAALHEPTVLAAPVQAVLSLVPAALWVVDRSLRITIAFGPGFDSLSLHPELDSIVGLDLYEYFGTDDPEFESIANHLRALEGESVVCESRLRGRIAEVRLEPLRERSEVVGVIGFALDVTERRQLELELQRAQRLETLGALAGGIAHDFNNVLSAISGYGELAAAELPQSSPARLHLEQVRRAADDGAAMTRRLLALGRCGEPDLRELDVNEVVRDVASMLRRLIGERIRLETLLDPQLPAVRADPSQLRRLLVNLAVNGRDAMPGGGVLTIATRFERTEGAVEISVRDTGFGMDAEVRERAFEPFFTTKREGAGTGLGLATVRGIVAESGGRIEVDSSPGRGTTFSIALPPAAAA